MNFTPEFFFAVIIVTAFTAYRLWKYLSGKRSKKIENYEPVPIPKDIYLKNDSKDNEDIDIKTLLKKDFEEVVQEEKILTVTDVQNKEYRNLMLSDLSSMPVWFENSVSSILLPHELIGIIQREFDLFDQGTGYKKILDNGTLSTFITMNGIKIDKGSLNKDPIFPKDIPISKSGLSKDFDNSEYDSTCAIPDEQRKGSMNSLNVRYTIDKNSMGEVTLNTTQLYKSYMNTFRELLKDGRYPTKVAFQFWYENAIENHLGEETLHTVKEVGDVLTKKFDNQINYYTSLKSQIKPKNLDGDNN